MKKRLSRELYKFSYKKLTMGAFLTAGVILLPLVSNNVYTEKAIANYSNSSSITTENNAQLDKSVRHAIYANNFNNTNPNVPMLNDGIQFSSKYTVINKETNQVESSGLSYEKPWDVLYKAIPLTYANGDVVDTKLYSELTSISKTTNTSNEVKQIDQEITFAKSGDVQIDASRVSGNIISGDFDDTKIEVKYKYNNTFYTFQELNALSGFSWSDVTAVSFKGNLDPSKSIIINAPLATVRDFSVAENNKNNIIETINEITINNKKVTSSATLVFQNFMYTVKENVFGKYIGTYHTVEPDGTKKYVQVEEKVQKMLPDVSESDLYYEMFRHIPVGSDKSKLEQEEKNGVVYSGSQYSIKLNRVFNAIKDEGFSLMATDELGVKLEYHYAMHGKQDIYTADGTKVIPGEVDPKSGVLLSKYYVELHKVLDTKDLKLNVGDSWSKFDNLIYSKTIADSPKNERDIPKDEIMVTHNVDTTKPGEYMVKYAYNIKGDNSQTITKTAKITVVGSSNPGDKDKSKDAKDTKDTKDIRDSKKLSNTGILNDNYAILGGVALLLMTLIVKYRREK